MKRIYLIFALLLTASITFSQGYVDALRFSEVFYGGSARFVATGSSFGALGGDLSTLATNPAGLGIYRAGEISFTPGIVMDNVETTFAGTKTLDNESGFLLNNIGIALAFDGLSSTSDWKSINFGFSYNRFNNFTRNINANGVNNRGSMLDNFMYNSDNISIDELNSYSTYLSWSTYLTTQLEDGLYTNVLWQDLPFGKTPHYGQTQSKYINTSGGAGEYDFSMAGNYSDFLYIGATIGWQSIDYKEYSTFREENFQNTADSAYIDLDYFEFDERLDVHGSGINFKLGIIVRPLDFIRLGAAIHTPTYVNLSETYSTSMYSKFVTPDSLGYYSYTSPNDYDTQPVSTYYYNLSTPFRFIGSLGLVISKFALLSAEYEYVDYSTARLSANDYHFTDENTDIDDLLASTFNIRTGLELRFGPLSLRGGYAMYGDPYTSTANRTNATRTQVSGGIGFVFNRVYADFAYVHTLYNDSYYFYNGYTDEPNPEFKITNGVAMATIGLKF